MGFSDIAYEHWCKRKAPKISLIPKFYQNYGLQGEEHNTILLTISFSSGNSIGIVSLSGTGKSYLADIYFNYLYPEELFYRIAGSGSRQALVNDWREIETKKGIYIEELQKLLFYEENKEILKNVLEGKKYMRRKVDEKNHRIIKQVINPVPVLFTIAIENQDKTYNEAEFSRRNFLTLHTDISKDTTRKVIRYKLDERFAKPESLRTISVADEEHMKYHVNNMIRYLPNFMYVNPFARYLDKIFDDDFLKIRSLITNYLDIIDCSAAWHNNNRFKLIDGNTRDHKNRKYDGKVFCTLQDMWNAHVLYGKQFFYTVLGIPPLGEELMDIFDTGEGIPIKQQKITGKEKPKKFFTVERLHREIKIKRKVVLTHEVIKTACDQLCIGNYLEKVLRNRIVYYVKALNIETWVDRMNILKCWDIGSTIMKQKYPECYESWLQSNLDDEWNLYIVDPVTYNKTILKHYGKSNITLINKTEETKDESDIKG